MNSWQYGADYYDEDEDYPDWGDGEADFWNDDPFWDDEEEYPIWPDETADYDRGYIAGRHATNPKITELETLLLNLLQALPARFEHEARTAVQVYFDEMIPF